MAHLHCNTHNRRVVSTPNNVVHRNGHGDVCTDKAFIIGESLISRDDLINGTKIAP